jgi:hypothetical protein
MSEDDLARSLAGAGDLSLGIARVDLARNVERLGAVCAIRSRLSLKKISSTVSPATKKTRPGQPTEKPPRASMQKPPRCGYSRVRPSTRRSTGML